MMVKLQEYLIIWCYSKTFIKLWKHIEDYWKMPVFGVLIVTHNNNLFLTFKSKDYGDRIKWFDMT
jgi:hypothetical protein